MSSDFNNCLVKAINDALLKLSNGFPNLNIAPLEPLYIPSLTIGEGKGAVHVVQNFRGINMYGATNGNMTKVDGSKIKEYKLYAEAFTPYLRLEAEYSLNGRILLIPIQGDGNCTITLENVKTTHLSLGEKLEKKGKVYMRVKKYIVTLDPGKVIFNFENLFNGDERLGKEMNNILNENWKDVFDDVKSGYEESFGIIFGDFANRVYSKIPFKDLFLE
ncbi:hypothetical protein ILUMI_19012 [Ignelater luminosus]|uniref:Protein takeout n=1 Tax=Ignelater luminosus TaxID=2038154 RepID=A0A8K0G5Z8_IGNLU|nr:hypothetical protein ILUMI_19012 [Ignelater luminosus]